MLRLIVVSSGYHPFQRFCCICLLFAIHHLESILLYSASFLLATTLANMDDCLCQRKLMATLTNMWAQWYK